MRYEKIVTGLFISRPNRFIAKVLIDDKEETVHVKNTGRLGELLHKGAKVVLKESEKSERKTKYDLIAVYKGDTLFNIDSQATNKVFHEYLLEGKFLKNIKLIKPEAKYKNSRFDFYVEYENKKAFIEVKGVTKEIDGVLMFPDAPTQRGAKHVKELCECLKEGYEAYVVFVIQTDSALYFTPDTEKDPHFSKALKEALKKGVHIVAQTCFVGEDYLEIKEFKEVRIQ